MGAEHQVRPLNQAEFLRSAAILGILAAGSPGDRPEARDAGLTGQELTREDAPSQEDGRGGFCGKTTGDDYVTVAYSAATGARLWAEHYNGPASKADRATSVVVNPADLGEGRPRAAGPLPTCLPCSPPSTAAPSPT